jgi:hypothetical protein
VQRRIQPFDVNPNRYLSDLRLSEQAAQKLRAYPSTSKIRKNRNINYAKLVRPTIHVQAAHRLTVDTDQLKISVAEVVSVVLRLSVELHSKESILLCLTPSGLGHFIGPGACI